jgi:hypothetical protein
MEQEKGVVLEMTIGVVNGDDLTYNHQNCNAQTRPPIWAKQTLNCLLVHQVQLVYQQ